MELNAPQQHLSLSDADIHAPTIVNGISIRKLFLSLYTKQMPITIVRVPKMLSSSVESIESTITRRTILGVMLIILTQKITESHKKKISLEMEIKITKTLKIKN